MLRFLFSTAAGMRSYQPRLDLIGTTAANVNALPAGPGRPVFGDGISQRLPPVRRTPRSQRAVPPHPAA